MMDMYDASPDLEDPGNTTENTELTNGAFVDRFHTETNISLKCERLENTNGSKAIFLDLQSIDKSNHVRIGTRVLTKNGRCNRDRGSEKTNDSIFNLQSREHEMEKRTNGDSSCVIPPRQINKQSDKRGRPAGRFYRWSRIVYLLVRVCHGLFRYAHSGIMDYDSLVHGKNVSDKGLVFDKDKFRRRKQFRWPSIYEETVQKPPRMRSPTDIRDLHKLMRCLRSFRRFDGKVQLEMCRFIRYERYTRNRVVIRQNHVAKAVYFVFSGSLSESFMSDNTEEVGHYKRGDIFGVSDVVLNQPRSSTITCEDFTEVLVLYLDDIRKTSILTSLRAEIQQRLNLIRNNGPLVNLGNEDALRLVSVAHLIQVPHGTQVDTGGKNQHWVYVLQKGSCCMTKWCHTQDLSPDLKKTLRKMHTSKSNNKIQTCDQYESHEMSYQQKLIGFLDSVDNKVSSRVSCWWQKTLDMDRRLSPESLPCSVSQNSSSSSIIEMSKHEEGFKFHNDDLVNDPSDLTPGSSSVSGDDIHAGRDEYWDTDLNESLGSESNTNIDLAENYGNKPENIQSTPPRVHSFCEDAEKESIGTSFHFPIRHLQPGTVFGSIFEDKTKGRVGFLSKSCVLLAIPLSVFLKTTSQRTISSIKLTVSQIPESNLLCSKYNKSLIWEKFKSDYIESRRSVSAVVGPRQNVYGYYKRSINLPVNKTGVCHQGKYQLKTHFDSLGTRKKQLESAKHTGMSRCRSMLSNHGLRNSPTAERHLLQSAPPHCSKTVKSQITASYYNCKLAPERLHISLSGVRPVLEQLPTAI